MGVIAGRLHARPDEQRKEALRGQRESGTSISLECPEDLISA